MRRAVPRWPVVRDTPATTPYTSNGVSCMPARPATVYACAAYSCRRFNGAIRPNWIVTASVISPARELPTIDSRDAPVTYRAGATTAGPAVRFTGPPSRAAYAGVRLSNMSDAGRHSLETAGTAHLATIPNDEIRDWVVGPPDRDSSATVVGSPLVAYSASLSLPSSARQATPGQSSPWHAPAGSSLRRIGSVSNSTGLACS